MLGRRQFNKEALMLSGALLGAVSCSLLYDLDKVQCEIDTDCAGFVETKSRLVKCLEGVCAYEQINTNSGGSSSGSGGSTNTNGGNGGTGNSSSSGGTGGGTGGNPTTTSGTGGSAGAAGAPPGGCQTNDECIEESLGNPAICRDGVCIDLYNGDECPIVLGLGDDFENLRAPKSPIIFGAYTFIGETIREDTPTTANYELAIDEINDDTGNGYKFSNNVRRPFVAVLCDAQGDHSVSMTHFTKTLKVPAIITPLYAQKLLEVFENETWGARDNNVFLMSPFGADTRLTNINVDPDGLMWHMLAEAVDLAPPYKPLLARAEAHVRATQNIPPEDPVRAVMVVADTPTLKDIAGQVIATAQLNGKSLGANLQDDPPSFLRIDIESASEVQSPDIGTVVSDIRTMKDKDDNSAGAQIVIAIAGAEFMYDNLIQSLEQTWAFKPYPPPFYLLSPHQYALNSTLTRVQQFEEPANQSDPEFIPLRQRVLGVNFAANPDTTLYDVYLSALVGKYSGSISPSILAGTENYYDAAYYTMYAIHGGGAASTVTGRDVTRGMKRLLGPAAQAHYVVGEGQANDTIQALYFGNQEGIIEVEGTMGPPDFSVAGARRGLASIYCVDLDPSGQENEMKFFPDVLTYDEQNESLVGDDPCGITDFMADP